VAVGNPKPLWQVGLDWLWEANGEGTHPYDERRAFLLARGLRMLGENPAAKEVNAYIKGLWREPFAAAMTREAWRSVYRARSSIGRSRRSDAPLFQPDRLIREQGLRPSTEERLAAVAKRALDELIGAAAEEPDRAAFLDRERQLKEALIAISHLRYLRFDRAEIERIGFKPRPQQPL
jgi:hypothetical protein